MVPTEANGVTDPTGTGTTGRKQTLSVGGEVIVITKTIVVIRTESVVVHNMMNHSDERIPMMVEALTETSVMMTEDLDVTLMISMCLKADLMNATECIIDSKKKYIVE